jgi:hypothetical protein
MGRSKALETHRLETHREANHQNRTDPNRDSPTGTMERVLTEEDFHLESRALTPARSFVHLPHRTGATSGAGGAELTKHAEKHLSVYAASAYGIT